MSERYIIDASALIQGFIEDIETFRVLSLLDTAIVVDLLRGNHPAEIWIKIQA